MPFSISFPTLGFIQQQMRKMPAHLVDKSRPVFMKSAAKLQQTMARRSMQGPLHARTGALGRSWRVDAQKNPLLPLSVAIQSKGVPYAKIHETGGTITTKNGQYLTIPLPGNTTPAGVMRISATQAINQGAFFLKSKTGNLLIMQRGAGKGELIPLFVLKKQVTIPPRLQFLENSYQTSHDILEGLDKILEKK